MRILILSGSGSNGKTTLVKILTELATQNGAKADTFLSTTRETFNRLGLTTEAAGLMKRADEQVALQSETFKDYLLGLENAVSKGVTHNLDFLFCDRSPYDYNGYVFNAVQTMDRPQVDERVARPRSRIDKILAEHNVHFWILPHRTPWPPKDDKYRSTSDAKNLVWNSVIQKLTLDESMRNPLLKAVVPLEGDSFSLQENSAARASYIWKTLYPDLVFNKGTLP